MTVPGGTLIARRGAKGLGTVPKFPVLTGASSVSVNENTTAVGTYSADEPVTWAIAGGLDAARFQISSGGLLAFSAAPDFEAPTDSNADNVYHVTIAATNASEGNTTQLAIVVAVQNIAVENPIITGSPTVSAPENQTAVASYTADRAVTWSISGGLDAAKFQISSSGVLTFVAAPDFEGPGDTNGDNIYQVTIAATDSASRVGTLTVLVTVTDAVDPLFVEDVFSTWLYNGNGTSQTINNGIDLAGKGGLVWVKSRSNASELHSLFDTARGVRNYLHSSLKDAANTSSSYGVGAFNSNGFTVDDVATPGNYFVNASGSNYASWTFRRAAKFFDVVTWTGDGTNNRQIAHALGVAPGMVVVKNTSFASDWKVWHTAAPTVNGLLNQTAAFSTSTTTGGPRRQGYVSAAGATSFTLTGGTSASDLDGVNATGSTYVAYLFAHDATADGVIQCGSFTADASGNANVNLGWEPQWLMLKTSATSGGWDILDNMRGLDDSSYRVLRANTANGENTFSGAKYVFPQPTGFETGSGMSASTTYIYIAIRRGPMRTPTTGTSVFAPVTGTTASSTSMTTGFPVDLLMFAPNRASGDLTVVQDRLRGGTQQSYTSSTVAEEAVTATNFDRSTGIAYNGVLGGSSYVGWNFRRAPGFFDVVCYTGDNGAYAPRPHNLGVAPELIINKIRGSTGGWWVKCSAGAGSTLRLEQTSASFGAPGSLGTATTFNPSVSDGSSTYVAYLFASCPGVSKVGTYTGNGSSQTINCGFTNGARFVLIKRTNTSGDWFVFDTARGILADADPYLRLNSTAAENNAGGFDEVDPAPVGFTVNQTGNGYLNVSGATYIYLAIA